MRAPLRHLLAASFLLALAGCGGDKKDPVQALCDLHFSCDCDQTNFPDVETCVTDLNAQVTALDDAAKMIASANGLDFDQDCADRSREIPSDFACQLEYEIEGDSECFACAVIHGDQPLGAGCTEREGFSDCARDLRCNVGVCVDPCQRLKVGDSCGQGNSIAICDDGLFCDSNNTKQCQKTGGVGSPCPTGDGCNEETFCGDSKTCEAPGGAGEPCGPLNQCAEAHYCDATLTCQTIPKNGEPCNDGICDEYLACVGGACEPGPGVGEPCPVAGQCGEGAECNGDTCVAEQAAVCNLEAEPTPDA